MNRWVSRSGATFRHDLSSAESARLASAINNSALTKPTHATSVAQQRGAVGSLVA